MDYSPLGYLLCPRNSPGKNTGVNSHSLLQGIFPTQELNPGLPHCRVIVIDMRAAGQEWVMEAKPTGWGYLMAGGWQPQLRCLTSTQSLLFFHVLSHVWLFVTSWTVACQVYLSMGFSRQEYRRGWPFTFTGHLPLAQGSNPHLLCLRISCVLRVDSSCTEPVRKPSIFFFLYKKLEIQTFNENSSRCWHKLIKYSINHQQDIFGLDRAPGHLVCILSWPQPGLPFPSG